MNVEGEAKEVDNLIDETGAEKDKEISDKNKADKNDKNNKRNDKNDKNVAKEKYKSDKNVVKIEMSDKKSKVKVNPTLPENKKYESLGARPKTKSKAHIGKKN